MPQIVDKMANSVEREAEVPQIVDETADCAKRGA